MPRSLRTHTASTPGCSSTTCAAYLSSRGQHGLPASGLAALCRIAGPGHDPEEDGRACVDLLKPNIKNGASRFLVCWD